MSSPAGRHTRCLRLGVYAAATSVVSIGNPNNNATAVVTPTHQLQTALTAPSNVVHAFVFIPSGCSTLYTPPTGKAIMVTQITYDLGNGTQGTENFAELVTPRLQQPRL